MPREGHDIHNALKALSGEVFQSTCPARGTTRSQLKCSRAGHHFNPRAPRGARPRCWLLLTSSTLFQSTCPARGTTWPLEVSGGGQCISIHVPREGHDSPQRGAEGGEKISIHVPREGHDPPGSYPNSRPNAISIHVPREGHDQPQPRSQSKRRYFNPRAPRGARRSWPLRS